MILRESTKGSSWKKLGLGIAAVLLISIVLADSPAPERWYTVTSPNEKYQFTMHPADASGTSTIRPYGEAFEATLGGDPAREAEVLWRVEGWYAFETFIADDGRGLVRLGPWASKPPNEELAIAFYRDGEEVRRYFVAELIDDPDSVRRSVSHYVWQKREQGYPRLTPDSRFELLTVENRTFVFDVETGELQADGPNDTPQPGSVRVTREDADDQFLVANLFRENGIDIDEQTVSRVIRSDRGTTVWLAGTFAGLPVFFHENGYRFDQHRRIRIHPHTDKPWILGEPLPPASAFPIDHRPDIAPENAVQTWLERVRSDEYFSEDYEPRTETETLLGFHNLRVDNPGDAVYRLVWQVRPKGSRYPVAMISAKKGDVLYFDNGIRTGKVPTRKTDSSAQDFVGRWSAAACGERRYARELTLYPNSEFRATDNVAPCPKDANCGWSGIVLHSGTWRVANARIIELSPRPPNARQGKPMPRAMGFDAQTGRLHEATPGAGALCEYRRTGDAPPSPIGREEPAEPDIAGATSACHEAVQGQLAWDYQGHTTWQDANVRRLCEGANQSTELAHCFDTIMHGSTGSDGGDSRWHWRNALELCAGTLDANATIGCFEDAIAQGSERRDAIQSCRTGP